MPSEPPPRKPSACVPCHERKIRCDSGQVGVPCSRCVSKDRVQECVLVGRSLRRRKREGPSNSQSLRGRQSGGISVENQNYIASTVDSTSVAPTVPIHSGSLDEERTPGFLTATATTGADRRNCTRLSSHAEENGVGYAQDARPSATEPLGDNSGSPDIQYTVSEQDAQLETWCRMSGDNGEVTIPTTLSTSVPGKHLVAYYSKLNSISVLGEVLGQRQRKRLIGIALPGPRTISAKQREFAGLEQGDEAYLNMKGVHDYPPKPACDALLRLFFDYVYPYTPILDRNQFVKFYDGGNCSSFLLFAILANVIPYASLDLVHEAGFIDRHTAQNVFISKARLLYDFGCEKNQLSVLQGSVLLSSFQFSFASDKDFRFWFHNAMRIAIQMGLHRENLGEDLDQATHKLCRRIWWLLFSRDIVFSISGFENARRISDVEADTVPLSLNDWDEEGLTEQDQVILSPITTIQKQFYIENCKLSNLGAKFLQLFKSTGNHASLLTANELAEDISVWRNSLPKNLQIYTVSQWSSANVWIIVLLSMSYRFDCILYRWIRERARSFNDDTFAWAKQRLHASMFELDSLVKKAIVQDLVYICPPSFIISVEVLTAFHIELALDSTSPQLVRITAKSQIQAGLSYLRSVRDKWHSTEWTLRVFEWVIKRSGLFTTPEGTDTNDRGMVFNADNYSTNRTDSGAEAAEQLMWMNLGGKPPEVAEGLPDEWLQAFLDGVFVGDFNSDELLNW